jgi:hypothetical protein
MVFEKFGYAGCCVGSDHTSMQAGGASHAYNSEVSFYA